MVRIPASKTAVPELPHWFIPRPWLWRPLEDLRDAQLVAIIAPAGAGKTTLLAEWARHDPGTPTAWVAVDPEDEDPWRLRSAVLAALVATGSLPPDHPVHRRLPEPRDGEDPTDDLLEVLDALCPPVRLVLDDVHVLTGDRAGTRLLDRLLRRRPAGVRIVVGARCDPPLGLPRLRMDGRLAELRAEQLRFGIDEAAALLAASGVLLDPAEVAVVHRRSEGWAAGLRLAAIALRSSPDPGGVLARFDGDERSVADYLAGEVLSALPTATRALLQDVSVCDHLPLALSVTLTGRPDAAHALDELADGAAMVERVAPTEYRLHGLLRSHLEADLARHRPARHRQLHATAARWWAERDEAAHALRHADHAQAPQLTAELLRRAGIPLLLAGDTAPVRHALAVLGPQGPREDPRLALTAALAHLEDRALCAAAADLAPAHGARSGEHDPSLEALIHTGRAATALGAGGDTVVARVQARRAVTLARAHGLHRLEVNALTLRAIAAVMDGDLGAVVATAEDARAAVARSGSHAAGRAALVTALAAYADLMRGEPERAHASCAEVLAAGDPLSPEAAYAVHVVHGSALAARGRGGDPSGGPTEARAARRAAGDIALPEPVVGALAALEHRAALRLGDHRAAGEVLDWLCAQTGETAEVLLMRAWSEAATGRHETARALAAPLRGTGIRRRGQHLVEVHLLEAEGALRSGDAAAGRTALEAALVEGRTLGLVAPFAWAGRRSRAELAARVGGSGTPYGRRIRTACAAPGDHVVPLSERELIVLTLLPSLLDAPAMAEELVVSVNTVRTQIRSIYAKLGVSTRRDAVARANERGLLV